MSNKNEFVKVVNISEQEKVLDDGKTMKFPFKVVQAQYNGQVFTIGKEPILLKREIAEHLCKKAYSVGYDVHSLRIDELPEGQRDPQNFASTIEKVSGLQKAVGDSEEKNLKLQYENDKIKARLAELEGKKGKGK